MTFADIPGHKSFASPAPHLKSELTAKSEIEAVSARQSIGVDQLFDNRNFPHLSDFLNRNEGKFSSDVYMFKIRQPKPPAATAQDILADEIKSYLEARRNVPADLLQAIDSFGTWL